MKKYLIFFLGVILLPLGCANYASSPKDQISSSQVWEYFETTFPLPKDSTIRILERIPLIEVEKRMNKVFKTGKYLDLQDPRIRDAIQKRPPLFWYREELKKYPGNYYSMLLYTGTNGIIGLNYVLIINPKGKIVALEKWGYGR